MLTKSEAGTLTLFGTLVHFGTLIHFGTLVHFGMRIYPFQAHALFLFEHVPFFLFKRVLPFPACSAQFGANQQRPHFNQSDRPIPLPSTNRQRSRTPSFIELSPLRFPPPSSNGHPP